jgi:hypothetical protein
MSVSKFTEVWFRYLKSYANVHPYPIVASFHGFGINICPVPIVAGKHHSESVRISAGCIGNAIPLRPKRTFLTLRRSEISLKMYYTVERTLRI